MSTHPELHEIVVNGEPRSVPPGMLLTDLLRAMNIDPLHVKGIAVAVNDEVVRKRDWKDVALGTGDRVEIVTANQGG